MNLGDFGSIRFRVSILLLLSTLNTILLATFVVTLLAVVRESPSGEQVRAVRAVDTQLDAIHRRVLDAARPGVAADDRVEAQLDELRGTLSGIASGSPGLMDEYQAYRDAVSAWQAHAISPLHVPSAGGEDATGQPLLDDAKRAHQRLVASLHLLVDYQRPEWVDTVNAWLPFGTVWIVVFSIGTVILAWSLRSQISNPLLLLGEAAETMGAGQYDAKIPDVAGAAPEIATLARALREAQTRILATIQQMDVQSRRTETMLEQLHDGVILTDAEGRIVEANTPAERMLAVLVGGVPATQTLPERLVELAPAWRGEGEAVVEIQRNPGASSRRRWFEARIRDIPRLGSDGRASRLVVLRDVSDAREVEQLMRDFLSVVTHELRTPLTAIEGYAKLLAMQKGGPLSDRQLGFVQMIQDQSTVLKSMIQNLLDTTRLEGGTLPIDPTPTEVGSIVGRLVQTWRGTVEARKMRFRCDVDDLVALKVNVNSARLEQVVGNLFSNAMKFTPEGGEIGLVVRREGPDLLMAVEDTGRGIPPEAQAQVFEKFFQVERGDTRVAGGTGLGLYISRMLVEAQGGRIGVSSEVGKGSRFSIHLPILTEESA